MLGDANQPLAGGNMDGTLGVPDPTRGLERRIDDLRRRQRHPDAQDIRRTHLRSARGGISRSGASRGIARACGRGPGPGARGTWTPGRNRPLCDSSARRPRRRRGVLGGSAGVLDRAADLGLGGRGRGRRALRLAPRRRSEVRVRPASQLLIEAFHARLHLLAGVRPSPGDLGDDIHPRVATDAHEGERLTVDQRAAAHGVAHLFQLP
jgi:hypothetical protein